MAKTRGNPKARSTAEAKGKKTRGKAKLSEYERKRSFSKTPEPSGDGKGKAEGNRFVIQEHHARRLHWDFRLEKDGVLVSWALPRGVPDDPKENRLAVHTEDHPLDYIDFEGEIPKGEYGAGEVTIWDRGTYEAEKFRDDEVILTLHGERVSGKYALFATKDKNWMIHRMDPPATDREPMPEHLEPMMATLSTLPPDQDAWAYEIKWDGVRAIGYSDPGHLRLESRNLKDITPRYPELRKLAEELGARRAVLDGEVVAFGDDGRPDFQRLQARMHLASDSAVRRRMADTPVTYVLFDLLYLDGESLLGLPYIERRQRLEELDLDGPSWQTPRNHTGDGAKLLEASRERDLEGIVAKRLGSRYHPGRRSRDWLKVKNVLRQELVVGGWLPGRGRREGMIGALLVGYHDNDGRLRYAGRVGTGYTEDDLKRLAKRLEPLRRKSSPFDGRQPPRESCFVEPRLVCEVEFREWTSARTLRAPSFKGLRDDKDPADVQVESPEPPPTGAEASNASTRGPGSSSPSSR
jgi:bifunctional non-homologous end joining protein LigD